jgi:hypothetical protein
VSSGVDKRAESVLGCARAMRTKINGFINGRTDRRKMINERILSQRYLIKNAIVIFIVIGN